MGQLGMQPIEFDRFNHRPRNAASLDGSRCLTRRRGSLGDSNGRGRTLRQHLQPPRGLGLGAKEAGAGVRLRERRYCCRHHGRRRRPNRLGPAQVATVTAREMRPKPDAPRTRSRAGARGRQALALLRSLRRVHRRRGFLHRRRRPKLSSGSLDAVGPFGARSDGRVLIHAVRQRDGAADPAEQRWFPGARLAGQTQPTMRRWRHVQGL